MRISRPNRSRPGSIREQRGVILIIALIVLVSMTLAAIGMTRSIDTANAVAGNLAFKQATIQSSDLGIKSAYDWLVANSSGTTLQNSDTTKGYFSANPSSTTDWQAMSTWGNAVVLNGGYPDAAGNVVRYMIHRLCTQPNTAYNGSNGSTPNQCALTHPSSGGSSGGSMAIGATQFEGLPQLYYLVSTRVDGPRNTVSIIHASILIQV